MKCEISTLKLKSAGRRTPTNIRKRGSFKRFVAQRLQHDSEGKPAQIIIEDLYLQTF